MCAPSMVASAGKIDKDLMRPQFPRNGGQSSFILGQFSKEQLPQNIIYNSRLHNCPYIFLKLSTIETCAVVLPGIATIDDERSAICSESLCLSSALYHCSSSLYLCTFPSPLHSLMLFSGEMNTPMGCRAAVEIQRIRLWIST